MTADTLVLPAPPVATAPRPRGWFRRLGVDTAYVVAGFPVSLAAFVVVVTGLTTGFSLVVVWFGIPLIALTLVVARGFATTERLWLPPCSGRSSPSRCTGAPSQRAPRSAGRSPRSATRSAGWTPCTPSSGWWCRSLPSRSW